MVVPEEPELVDLQGLHIPIERLGFLKGHAWEQMELPAHCREDVLLSLCNSGPIGHAAQLVVLHDASVKATSSSYNRSYRMWHSFLMSTLMRRVRVIASVSEFSASELMRYFPGRRKRPIEIVYESGEHILNAASRSDVLTRLGLVGQHYVLAVGSRTPNKNFSAIVSAASLLSEMNVKIVAVGGVNRRIFSMTTLSSPNLILAGYVNDGELRSLYENAQCFVFPSLYEGFGLPPLEAMHCGCPTLVSNRSAMPEICGPASLYCEPDDPTDIARQLRRVLSSEALRSEMREAGFARTKSFTWRKAAERLDCLIAACV